MITQAAVFVALTAVFVALFGENASVKLLALVIVAYTVITVVLYVVSALKAARRDSTWRNQPEECENVADGLKSLYKNELLPLENVSHYHEMVSPPQHDPDFDAKPMILILGQYSTGKTTFIKHIIEHDFPGMRIGPEPTTDRFIALMHGEKSNIIPGNALVGDKTKPFGPLAQFGNAFLTKFQCSTLPLPILQGISIIDSPGILSGEKQRVDRGYDFTAILKWFSERVDRIILLFDANKLDISDEFRYSLESLNGKEDKIRILLNKADSMDSRSLVRVYGALMWSLGKVWGTPEVAKVFIGSFWDKPLVNQEFRKLFEEESQELFQDLQLLPTNSLLRKINDFGQRVRQVITHALIMQKIKNDMPMLFGRAEKKAEIIENLEELFNNLQRRHKISLGDFPPVTKMKEVLRNFDFERLQSISPEMISRVRSNISPKLSELLSKIPTTDGVQLKDGVFDQVNPDTAPLINILEDGFHFGEGDSGWIVDTQRSEADTIFDSINPPNGTLNRTVIKSLLMTSGLPTNVLNRIFLLADIDADGQFDREEFALAQYILNLKLKGHNLPKTLPQHLIPPAKR